MSELPVEKPEVLLVDDSKVIRLAARKMLGTDYTIHLAEDGQIGWEMLQDNSAISVIFSDLSMPNLNGMELLEKIRTSSNEQIASLPVVILTGADDSEAVKKQVFDAGATDFISKPFESIDLLSRAKAYARLSRKVVELEKKTGYDKLTGLYNATLLVEQGAKAFSFASRHHLHISAIYFEIHDFQNCFLTHGKKVAQHIIVAVGKRLQEVMREEDIAARLGVAKYALILPMTNKKKTRVVIERIRESISKLVFNTGREKIRVSFKTGYSSPEFTEELEFNELLDQADDALQRAMSSTEQVISFDDVPEVEAPAPVITEQDIEQAFDQILAGDFYKIPEQHIQAVVERLSPFIAYADDQLATDVVKNLTQKNTAVK